MPRQTAVAKRSGRLPKFSESLFLRVLANIRDGQSTYEAIEREGIKARGGGVDQIRIYRAESNRSDSLAVNWTEDIKVTSSVCARHVTVSDAA